MSRSSVLIIPSLNPDSRLTAYIKNLIHIGFSKIIVVDDGSAPQYQPIFDAVKSLPHHPEDSRIDFPCLMKWV